MRVGGQGEVGSCTAWTMEMCGQLRGPGIRVEAEAGPGRCAGWLGQQAWGLQVRHLASQ